MFCERKTTQTTSQINQHLVENKPHGALKQTMHQTGESHICFNVFYISNISDLIMCGRILFLESFQMSLFTAL